MKILITGGSGFIGTNLVSDLLEQGHRVLIYDKQKSTAYPDLCSVADIRDKEKLIKSLKGVDAVFHLAAEHRDDVHPVSLYYDVNLGGAENLAAGLEKNGVTKLIYTSTSAVYGINAGEATEDSPTRPFNDYGKSKFEAERIFNNWADPDSSNCLVTVRPTVIFGENNRGNVYNLLHLLSSGRFIMVGNGKNKKSMGYVLNLTRFLTTLLKLNPGNYVYNYADKPDLSVNELLMIANHSLGKTNRFNFRVPYTLGLCGGYVFDFISYITKKQYNISSIRIKKFCADTRLSAEKLKETGFKAQYSLADGLRQMLKSEFA